MKSKNVGLIIAIVVLSLLVVELGGFIIYDKVLLNDKIENNNNNDNNTNNTNSNNDNSDNNATNGNINYQHNLTKRIELQAVREGYVEIVVDTEGNAYLSLIGNLDYENDATLKNNLLKLQKSFKDYFPKNYTSFGGSKVLNAYKLDIEKVLTVYFVNMGNGSSKYFIFVKENGTLSYLSNDSIIHNGEINLKNIDNLDNVVSIVENTYTLTPYAIDLNGNEISLFDYIK